MLTKSLLLIACSDRKFPFPGEVPAIERYDGVTYRVIHKMQRDEQFPQNVDILILSAKFGLIDAMTPIPIYNQRMDKQRAQELRTQVQQTLQARLSECRYAEIYIDMGKVYLLAVEGFVVPQGSKVTWAQGRIGERLKSLKQWLSLQRS